jgi:hypothetical protein
VSKRLRSHYRSGRSPHWELKIKNAAAPAVKREAEEDWATRVVDANLTIPKCNGQSTMTTMTVPPPPVQKSKRVSLVLAGNPEPRSGLICGKPPFYLCQSRLQGKTFHSERWLSVLRQHRRQSPIFFSKVRHHPPATPKEMGPNRDPGRGLGPHAPKCTEAPYTDGPL